MRKRTIAVAAALIVAASTASATLSPQVERVTELDWSQLKLAAAYLAAWPTPPDSPKGERPPE